MAKLRVLFFWRYNNIILNKKIVLLRLEKKNPLEVNVWKDFAKDEIIPSECEIYYSLSSNHRPFNYTNFVCLHGEFLRSFPRSTRSKSSGTLLFREAQVHDVVAIW